MLNYSLIVPIINTGEHLQKQLSSILEEVVPECLLVIDNSCGKDETIRKSLDRMFNKEFKNIEKTEKFLHIPEENMGVANSWNYGIKNTKPPWIIINSDLFFKNSHAIQEILRLLNESDMCIACGLSLFGLNESAIDKAGNFDENFWPAYNEDLDYVTRLSLMGGKITQFVADVIHDHSSSINNDSKLKQVINKTHRMNDEYYIRKWGSKNRYTKEFISDHTYCDWKNPFNDVENSPKDWILDNDFMAEKKEIYKKIMDN